MYDALSALALGLSSVCQGLVSWRRPYPPYGSKQVRHLRRKVATRGGEGIPHDRLRPPAAQFQEDEVTRVAVESDEAGVR